MDPDGHPAFILIIILILILINAFFSASEIAIVTLNDGKIKKMAEDGNTKAQTVLKLLAKPSNFLASIQVGVTLAGFFASSIASANFSAPLTRLLMGASVPESVANPVTMVVITLLLSYFTLVFGELVPKRIAMHNAEGVAFSVCGILAFLLTVFKPFADLLAFSTNLVAKPLGIQQAPENTNVTEEEIRMMVDVGEENGTIEESEKEMINNVFEFNDRLAGEIMTHRTEVAAVEITDSLDDVIQIGLAEGFSRIPVFEDDLDNIVGIIYIKDLLRYVGRQLPENFQIRDVMRTPLFVPETKRARELFKALKLKKQHMAVVIDEYGGTAGIITMEDLLESIVGDIQDEYDNEEAEFSKIDASTYTIDGGAELYEVSELLDVKLPEGEYDTLGGLIIDRLGRIPQEGEHPTVRVAGVDFTVEKVEDRHIERVRAVKIPQPPAAEGSSRG